VTTRYIEYWMHTQSTNPLERLNPVVKRRTDIVGIFPDAPAVLRSVGAILMETHDEWQVDRRCFSLESMHKLLHPEPVLSAKPVPLRLTPVH
jgi:putative transposase